MSTPTHTQSHQAHKPPAPKQEPKQENQVDVATMKPGTAPKTAPKDETKTRNAPENETPSLSADFLSAPIDVDGTLAAATAPVRDRSAKQRALDNVVSELSRETIERGHPKKWAQMAKKGYPVPPTEAEGLRKMVRKAGGLHDVRIRFGKPARTEDGKELVVFAVIHRDVVTEEDEVAAKAKAAETDKKSPVAGDKTPSESGAK